MDGPAQPEGGISKVEYEALASFRYALRQFLRFSEEAAHALGLTPQQHQALPAIQGFPGSNSATVGDLAERLQVKHHSAVGLVGRLEVLGLVARQASAVDRRQVHVSLTPLGERMLESLSRAHREELRRIGPQLAQLLKRLSEDMPG